MLARRTAPTDSARAADKSARSTARVFTWQPHQDRDILCQQGAASRRRTGLLHPDPTQAADSQDKDSQRSMWTLRADTTLTCRVGQHAHTRLPCPDSRLAMDSKSNRQLLHVRALMRMPQTRCFWSDSTPCTTQASSDSNRPARTTRHTVNTDAISTRYQILKLGETGISFNS